MKKSYYLPRTAPERVIWLNNFAAKIGAYATKYGITAAEVTLIVAMAAFYSYWVDVAKQAKLFKEKITKFLGTLSSAPAGTPLGELPAFAPAAPPIATTSGIFTFIGGIVRRIKGNAAYAMNDGEDLGIIGEEQELDESNLQLEISAAAQLDGVKITFKKNGAEAANIYSNPIGQYDTQTWVLLGTDFHSPYLDTRPIETAGKPENRRYMARPVIGDKETGMDSKTVSVVFGPALVQGQPLAN